MSNALDGVRVLEVAAWMFVPAAGGILADWGADVVKVEHPVTGDPQRGLSAMGLIPGGPGAVNYIVEQPNRGKRSVGLDISTDHGRRLLYRLAETSDVFLTSFLPGVRQKLQIDVEHIRAVNPNIVYARGTGQGTKGPDAGKGGLDGSSYWARGGVSYALTPPSASHPISGRPGFGDLAGGMSIAGGIAAALLQRERTGVAPIVDVSLLGLAMWVLSPDIVASGLYGGDPMPRMTGHASPNPLVGVYATADGRHVSLMMLQSDRYWAEFCRHIEREDLIDEPRFADAGARFANHTECIRILDEVFASRTLDDWVEALRTLSGVWEPVRMPSELAGDPQVMANGYLRTVERGDGQTYDLVANPVQLDERADTLAPAPEHGQHTEEVLLDLGVGWDEIAEGKASGAIL
jgi:crotonobetainyl-CoA:carnitine CoA-transferase CaiB-like acyl-CoA transferase